MAVFCGQCGKKYADDAVYLDTVCDVTKVKPTEPESMGNNWDKIQAASIKRGKDDSTAKRVDAALAAIDAHRKK